MPRKMNVRFPLHNNYVFEDVFTQPELCKELLQIILPEVELHEFLQLNMEFTIKINPKIRGIRLDIYGEDGKCIFAIEMQVDAADFPAERDREYHSMIDANNLLEGMKPKELKTVHLIVITMSPPFDSDQMVTHIDKTARGIGLYDDRSYTHYIYAKGKDTEDNPRLNAFCHYLAYGEVGDDPFVKKIHEEVLRLNNDEEWRKGTVEISGNMYEVFREMEKENFEKGTAFGKERATGLMAFKFFESYLQDGMSVAEAYKKISDICKLPLDYVKQAIEKGRNTTGE
ncbi:MAG: hypothetical protein IJ225_11820 [Solobacterium sp.]|nr:hypothetical protein [Solobacterium sp.]